MNIDLLRDNGQKYRNYSTINIFLPSVYVWKKMTHDILFFFNYAKIYTEEFKNSPLNVITKPYPKMIKN